MVYPVKMQVRYSTVVVIVLLLMGSVFYEVTRTESIGRQSAARTQDIALPAPQPVVHTISGATRMDYIRARPVDTVLSNHFSRALS